MTSTRQPETLTRQPAPTKTDVGYAWIIVFATFFLQAIGDGVRNSYGLIFVEFLEEFQQGKGQTAWTGSLMSGVYNLGGPVSAFIINKFGYRIGSMAGSVITALALILSSFAPSLGYLCFTYGVLHGFGSGLYSLSGTVATGKYFKKKKALALGVTYCGGGIGTFVMLPITRLLIDHYSWRGALYILAGIVLNGCVFASLFRPFIELYSDKDQNGTVTKKLWDNKQNIYNDAKNAEDKKTSLGVPLLPIAFNEKNPEELPERRRNNKPSLSLTDIRTEISKIQKEGVMFYSCLRLEKSSEHDQKPNVNGYINASVKKKLCLEIDNTVKEEMFKNKLLESLFPKKLVTNITFIILMCSTVFIAIPEFVPYSMLPDFGQSVNCAPSQTAWFLSVLGIGAMISNVCVGWLADLKCVHNLCFLGGCILTVGTLTMIIAVIPRLEMFFIYSALYGIFSAAMYGVQVIVLMEYFGEHSMASIVGITMWVYGMSGLIGTPAAGWLFDSTGSYTASFLATGACFVLSGLINFLVLCTKQSKETNE